MSNLRNLHRTVAKLAQNPAPTEIAFDVQKVAMLDDRRARMLIRVPTAHQKHLSDETLTLAVASQYEGVRVLPGSLYREHDASKELFGVFVARNQPSMSMEQASAAGFTAISDTVFQDADDNVWTKVGNGENAYLSINREEDIASLLGAVRTRAIATASVGVQLEEDFARGDVVRYYDVNREEAGFGIAIDGKLVYNPERDALVEVSSQQVIVVNDATQVEVETAAVGDADKGALLEYMRKLYGHHPAFFAEIKAIINKGVMV